MKLLVTGGAGFIGAAFVRMVLETRPGWQVVVLDALTYAASLDRLGSALDDPHCVFVEGDIRVPDAVDDAVRGCDAIVNLAAETHVDRSIAGGVSFASTNVVGTQVLLEAARAHAIRRFVQVGTDEVYGPLPHPERASEEAALTPRNIYAASKAGADLLVQASAVTHEIDAVITRGCNTYGPWQYPEKAVPVWITRGLRGLPLPLYGSGDQVRDWVHVDDHCRAILLALERGERGAIYNVSTRDECKNRVLAEKIAGLLDLDARAVISVADRPGHDARYGLDSSRIRALGWQPRVGFEQGLTETVAWYRDHRSWWEGFTD